MTVGKLLRLFNFHGIGREWVLAVAVALFAACAAASADEIELLTGSRIEGEFVARDAQSITIKTTAGGRTFTRKYPTSRIRAIVTSDGRELLNGEETAAGEKGGTKSQPGAPAAAKSRGKTASSGVRRTRAEIDALVAEQGRTPPQWWSAVALDYPKTLDLSFPEPAPGGWDNQRNVGQYFWDIIHPNPGKWREGIRLMHHLLTVNKDDPEVCLRAMNTLGRMYFTLEQDYARAAFWWRKAAVEKNDRFWSGVQLAECYWKLGNKTMALDLLNRTDPQFSTIKLLADMGETSQALRMAEASTGGQADDLAFLYAGDACRVAGQHQKALQYYEKVLRVPAEGRAKGRIERNQQRARANLEAIKLFELLDLAKVPDGVYQSSSMGYEAPVHVEVTVKAGRIEDVKVTGHREKQFYSAMTDTCRKIVAKQDVKGIDATSCATITSEAIINATAKALSGAMKP